MASGQKRVLRACEQVLDRIESDPAYERVSGLLVEVGGEVRFAVDRRGPAVADVFAVTQSVTATLVGIALGDGAIPDLDAPAAPSPHTWRQLLTMTRGCATDGDWDLDAVMARPYGWLPHWLDAPQVTAPGTKFRYDDSAYHLLTAALLEVTGRRLADFAAERLFTPLGIEEWAWPTDPEGFHLGFGHLRLGRPALASLGRLWLDQGRVDGEALLPPEYARAMVTAHTPGGAPEWKGYGFGLWVDKDKTAFFASGWAGQHVLVVPAADAVVVTTGDAGFDPGPPPTDEMPLGWRPAVKLVREILVPVLLSPAPTFVRLFDATAGEVRTVTPATGRILRIAAGDGVRVAVVADLLRRVADRRRWRTGVAGFSSLTDRQLLSLNVHPFQDPAAEVELSVHAATDDPPTPGRPVTVAAIEPGGIDPLAAPPGTDPLAARLALLRRPYREPVALTPADVGTAAADLDRWRGLVAAWAEQPSAAMAAVEAVVERIEDDLDVPGALMELERLAADDTLSPGARFEAFAHLDRLLGLDLAADVGKR